jgi:hypothetical protein
VRPIPLIRIEGKISADWAERAKAALEEVRRAAEADRARIINSGKYQKIWTDLKELLWEASCHKCWYCESIDDRSDNAVDHFRPKNRIAESRDSGHNGYWWLAFEWRNYRFTCTFCNSYRKSAAGGGGKQDHFPLWNEMKRAKKPEDPLEEERPLLLDPTEVADCAELTFDDNGMAVPIVTKEGNPYRFERATQTIKLCHLNHPTIVERRAMLMRKIRVYLKEADAFYRKREGDDATAEAAYKWKLRDIYYLIVQEAPYSAAARATIGATRGESVAARDLFSVSL